MSDLFGAGDLVFRVIGTIARASGLLGASARTAMASMALSLLRLVAGGTIQDLKTLKEQGLRRCIARSTLEEARARKALAEAMEAENRHTSRAGTDDSSRQGPAHSAGSSDGRGNDEKLLKAQAARDRAAARLLEAIIRLNEQGGLIAVSAGELQRLTEQPELRALLPVKLQPMQPVKLSGPKVVRVEAPETLESYKGQPPPSA